MLYESCYKLLADSTNAASGDTEVNFDESV